MPTRKTNTRTPKTTGSKAAKKHTSAPPKPRATPEQREAAERAALRRAENETGAIHAMAAQGSPPQENI